MLDQRYWLELLELMVVGKKPVNREKLKTRYIIG